MIKTPSRAAIPLLCCEDLWGLTQLEKPDWTETKLLLMNILTWVSRNSLVQKN